VTSKPKVTRINSAGSDTDSMLARNAITLGKKPSVNRHTMASVEKVELFSTDSEMDSFFKENETIVNKNSKYNNDLFSSSTSPNKTDENTMNEDLDDDEFDRIVSEAQRYIIRISLNPNSCFLCLGEFLLKE
jgi:hypothetical protein